MQGGCEADTVDVAARSGCHITETAAAARLGGRFRDREQHVAKSLIAFLLRIVSRERGGQGGLNPVQSRGCDGYS